MRLAAQGLRESGGTTEKVDDPWLAGQLRRQAREIHIESLLAALVITGAILIIPG